MKLSPLALIALILFASKPAGSEPLDYFHGKLENLAAHFASLNIPDLEKIQLPQAQKDGSYIFLYVWFPKTHRPTTESFEANIGDYFDIAGSQTQAFDGWCYTRKPEKFILKTGANDVGVMRIWALSFNGHQPRQRCRGGFPGAAGRLGQTRVFKDPSSGLLSMVRSGHPTQFPSVGHRVE